MRVGSWSGDYVDVDHAQLTKQIMYMKLLFHIGQDEMISADCPWDSFSYGDTTISSLDIQLVHNPIQKVSLVYSLVQDTKWSRADVYGTRLGNVITFEAI